MHDEKFIAVISGGVVALLNQVQLKLGTLIRIVAVKPRLA